MCYTVRYYSVTLVKRMRNPRPQAKTDWLAHLPNIASFVGTSNCQVPRHTSAANSILQQESNLHSTSLSMDSNDFALIIMSFQFAFPYYFHLLPYPMAMLTNNSTVHSSRGRLEAQDSVLLLADSNYTMP